MVEFRGDDLSFTEEEAMKFFHDYMRLKLTEQQILALLTRTEGWAAGLQLAAVSVANLDETGKQLFIDSFAGTDRHILDYLIEEVLDSQPEAIKDFLLHTSVLSRRSRSSMHSLSIGVSSSRLIG